MRIFIVKRKSILIAVCVVLALIALVVAACALIRSPLAPTMRSNAVEEYELNVLAGKQRELPVYSVEQTEQVVALTIDAAWEDDKTQFILDTLKKYDVKATFFLCGVWVKAYPEHVKAIAKAGHEIGNHSMTHPHMNALDKEAIQKDVSLLNDEVERLTGKRCTLFRAPYGEYNNLVIQTLREMGYEVVQWDIDTIDWKPERAADTILNSVIPKLNNGSIILCHNNGYQLKNYLPALIEQTLEKGYRFVTVSELLLDGETTIDHSGRMQPSASSPAPSPLVTPAPA